MARLHQLEPDLAALDRLDAEQTATLRRAAEFLLALGQVLLPLPPNARDAGYRAIRAEAARRGLNVEALPPVFDARAEREFFAVELPIAAQVERHLRRNVTIQ